MYIYIYSHLHLNDFTYPPRYGTARRSQWHGAMHQDLMPQRAAGHQLQPRRVPGHGFNGLAVFLRTRRGALGETGAQPPDVGHCWLLLVDIGIYNDIYIYRVNLDVKFV